MQPAHTSALICQKEWRLKIGCRCLNIPIFEWKGTFIQTSTANVRTGIANELVRLYAPNISVGGISFFEMGAMPFPCDGLMFSIKFASCSIPYFNLFLYFIGDSLALALNNF